MKTPAESRRRGGAAQAAVMLAVALGLALQAGGAESASRPAGAPSDPATTRAFTPDNISEAAIELTYRQKMALSAVRDGQHWNETAFHIMLGRTEELIDPDAAAGEYMSLESPAIGHLTDYPNRYRAQKIRATMWVYKSREYVSGSKDWDARAVWPKGKKVWYMSGLRVSEDGAKAEDLVVYSLVDPTELLGKPSGRDTSGEHFYGDRGRAVQLAAVYYKTFRQESLNSSPTNRKYRDYPLVIAYYLKPARRAEGPKAPGSGLVTTLFIALLFLVVVLYLVRRQTRRVRSTPIGSGGTGTVKYTPLRNTDDDDLPLDQQDVEPVDPALVDAVQEFENKRKQADGTDGKS